ncbi:unnamed protein product, partial [Durusdinium trenchii]
MKEDSCHRDTTFNSLYLEVETGTLHDVTGGLPDLAQGLVRSPHPEGAKASFLEDPVRLLRLLRFAARYDFRLDDEVLRAAEDAQVHKALGELLEHQRGRVLFEVKKALLLHNQPWRFLELCGACEVHPILFTSVPSPLWPGAVGTVRRLGQLLLYGLESEQLTARSQRFRGRIQGGLPPALLTPDWRKLGVWENDWVELLVAALAWRLKVHPGQRHPFPATDLALGVRTTRSPHNPASSARFESSRLDEPRGDLPLEPPSAEGADARTAPRIGQNGSDSSVRGSSGKRERLLQLAEEQQLAFQEAVTDAFETLERLGATEHSAERLNLVGDELAQVAPTAKPMVEVLDCAPKAVSLGEDIPEDLSLTMTMETMGSDHSGVPHAPAPRTGEQSEAPSDIVDIVDKAEKNRRNSKYSKVTTVGALLQKQRQVVPWKDMIANYIDYVAGFLVLVNSFAL